MTETKSHLGALFLLSSWYTRKELALRTSILYSGSLLSGGFGGLIGAGVQANLDGALSITAWRWLFIIEASLTVFVAICAIFVLPDFPHTTRSFTQEERAIAIRRLQDTSGSRDTKQGSVLTGLHMAVCDYKVWLLALVIITKTSAGAVTSFIPTLVKTFKYGKIETLLLVAPPYVFATLVALLVSFSSDRRAERSLHIIVPIFFAMVGYIIAAATTTLAMRYVSLFLMLGGVYGSYNISLAWISSTLPCPLEKRSAAIALVNTVGNIAQIYSPYMYLKQNGPRYLSAMVANTCFCLACLLATLALRWLLNKENDKLEIVEMVHLQGDDKVDVQVKETRNIGGVRLATGFRYVL